MPFDDHRRAVIEEARREFHDKFPLMRHATGTCLFWAWCAVAAVNRITNQRAILQAGTCYWPRMPKAKAAKTQDIYLFGYEWKWDDLAREKVRDGCLPEMHVWAAVPEEKLIIDMASGMFPAQCKKLLGREWESKKPPDCFWRRSYDKVWPEDVVYKPDVQACLTAHLFIRGIIEQGGVDLVTALESQRGANQSRGA